MNEALNKSIDGKKEITSVNTSEIGDEALWLSSSAAAVVDGGLQRAPLVILGELHCHDRRI